MLSPSDPSNPSDPIQGSASSATPATLANSTPRDAAYWARQGTDLKAGAAPHNEVNNVDGRNAVGPLQGFGKMWQKTYRVRLAGALVTPVEVIRAWKENFPSFWPRGNRFYLPLTGITPGEVAILRVKAGGMPLSTGVLVLYADDESFTLMTPQGHLLAGWITFSSYVQDGVSVAQAQVLVRANDPIYEFGARFLGGYRQEDKFWQHTLQAVAAHFAVTNEPVQTEVVCVDPHVRWRYAGNIRYNAAIRTILLGPTRWFRRAR
jgi:hypothetical protein